MKANEPAAGAFDDQERLAGGVVKPVRAARQSSNSNFPARRANAFL
jgi:hypothetical protein